MPVRWMKSAKTIPPDPRLFEGGRVTRKFDKLAKALLVRRSKAYRALAR